MDYRMRRHEIEAYFDQEARELPPGVSERVLRRLGNAGRRRASVAAGAVVLGAACWVLMLVFVVGQVVLRTPYVISASLYAVVGILTVLGAIGTCRAWPMGRLTIIGLGLIIIAGVVETLMASSLLMDMIGRSMYDIGVYQTPGNIVTYTVAHFGPYSLVAFVSVSANVGVLLLGAAIWPVRRTMAILSLMVGGAGLLSLEPVISTPFIGLEIAIPISIATVNVGMVLLRASVQVSAKSSSQASSPERTVRRRF